MPLHSVYVNDDNTGCAVGDYGTILKTINGGTTWTVQLSGTSYLLYFVCSANPGKLYVVGDYGTIFTTIDGGSTWTALSGCITTDLLSSVFFTDANTGYAVGGVDNHWDETVGIILKTTNGGNTWSSIWTGQTYHLNSVFFTDGNTGYAVGYVFEFWNGKLTKGAILKTTDGGTTWNSQYSTVLQESFNSVYFTDSNTGYIACGGGTILKTSDAGQTWATQSSGTTSLYSIYFPDVTTGYAAGPICFIKTTNGGSTWTAQTFPWYTGTSVFFTSADTGYVTGASPFGGGSISKTTDGGTTWVIIETINYMSSVYFTDMNTGYAVGGMGTILKTTDGGTTWGDLSIKTYNNLASLFFPDPNTGWIVGANGTILNTTNGGTTGINEAKQPGCSEISLKIYPNPAFEKISIESSELGNIMNGTVFVHGMTGQELINQKVQGPGVEINVSSLPAGIYFIRYMDKEKTESGKFIKE